MEDVICNYDRKGISESYGNVLSALVLWDEIQFPTNERDFWKHVNIPDDRWAREVEILRQNIKPIDDADELFDKEKRSFFRCNKDIFDESITEVVGVGAMRYLSLSNYLGLDYLPCEKRREFIHRYPDICRESFNRINSLKPLDSEIEKVIDEITQEFGSCFLTISRPVLVDYIRDNTPKDIPPFLTYGIFVGVHMPICLGMEVVLCPNPNADEFVKAFKKYRPNHFAGGALHIDKLMQDPKVQKMDLSFLKTPAFGGDSVTDVWIDRVNDFFHSHGTTKYMARGYGMTEAAGTFATSNQSVQEMIPFPTNNVMIRDVDTDEELKINQEGEIYITGPSLMKEYYGKSDETAKAFIKIDGITWLKTGDLGYVASSGELVISGRLKRIYWTLTKDGVGYRVYPMKIERVISKHENVDSVAVVGVRHPERAYISIAYLKLKDEYKKNSTISEIKDMCAEELSENSLPYRYRVIDRIPTTKAGKIDYKMLEQMVTNIEADV